MNICVFDTETTDLNKCFCYDVGYMIVDTDTKAVLLKRSFVAEQTWHNAMVFCSAYYADKRPIYVKAMRKRKMVLEKWGYICQQMSRDFKAFGVEYAFAYNSPFDEKVFDFNCDWFKCMNPFDNVAIHDIRAYAIDYIVDDNYKQFCEANGYFTEAGNYSTTAEIMHRYNTKDTGFIESHTALSDAEIETDILFECVNRGADITIESTAPRSIDRPIQYDWDIVQSGSTIATATAKSVFVDKNKHKITFRG